MNAKIIFVCAIFLSGMALAQESAPSERSFESEKTEALSRIEKQVTRLQQHKTCVESTQDREALQKCRRQMRDSRISEIKERRGRRGK